MLNALRLAALMALAPLAAQADEATRYLRLLGEMPAGRDEAPTRIVLDIALSPTGEPYQTRIEGWLAALEPEPSGASVDGACVESRCVISGGVGYRQMTITGDFAAPSAPVEARYAWDTDNDNPLQGVVRLTPLGDEVPGVGRLAPRDAVTADQLAELLAWAGHGAGFTNDYDDDPPGSSERMAIANWQAMGHRAGAGLILAADLETLRKDAQDQRNTLGWSNLKADGWSGGYPSLMLPTEKPEPRGRRFTTPTGESSAVFAFDPPMTEEEWDAFVEARTADRPGRESGGYTRVNDDMEIHSAEGPLSITEVYRRQEKGVARMVLSYPSAEAENWAVPEAVMARSFRGVED